MARTKRRRSKTKRQASRSQAAASRSVFKRADAGDCGWDLVSVERTGPPATILQPDDEWYGPAGGVPVAAGSAERLPR